MDPGKVIADVVFASGGGQRYTPTVLSLNRTAFSRDDVVTGQIETLLYAFGGAFEVKPVEGLHGDRAGEELAQFDAGGQRERHRVGATRRPRASSLGTSRCRSRCALRESSRPRSPMA